MAVYRRRFVVYCVVTGLMFCTVLYQYTQYWNKNSSLSKTQSQTFEQRQIPDTWRPDVKTHQRQKHQLLRRPRENLNLIENQVTELKNKNQILSLYKNVCNAYDSDIQILQPELQFKSLVLVIVMNNPLYDIIPLVELQYRPLFPEIVYCISNGDKTRESLKNWDVKIVYYETPQGVKGGFYNYICVDYVHELGLKADGFLFMGDDVLVSPTAVAKFSRQNLPATTACKIFHYNCTASRPCRKIYIQETAEKLAAMRSELKLRPQDSVGPRCDRAVQNMTGQKEPILHCMPDIFYIPSSFMEDASQLFRLFHRYRIYLSAAHAHVLLCLSAPSHPNAWDYVDVWKGREDFTQTAPYVVSRHKMVVHPVKLSPLLKRTEKFDKYFCKSILPFLHKPKTELHKLNPYEKNQVIH